MSTENATRHQSPASSGNISPAPSRLALHWQPNRWLRLLGWQGILGIGLLVTCAAFYFSTLQESERHLEQVQQSALSLKEQIRRAEQGFQGKQRPPAEQLADFYRIFPSEKELPDWLDKIFTAAQAQGLTLEQGEYKTSRDKNRRLMHYQITLPMKAEYPKIREFLASLANDVPIVGLEQIQFERQKVGDRTVDTKIKLVLYLEKES